MRIKTIEDAEKLIIEQYDQMQFTLGLLNFMNVTIAENQSASRSQFTENLESNIKYYCFIMASFSDLLVILKGFINSNSRWEEIFYSKKGFLVIYESINTYHKNQKGIRDLIEGNLPELANLNTEANLKLRYFKKSFNYESEMAIIRNEVAGHYNVDFYKYYGIITKLDRNKSIEAIESFLIFLMSVIYLVRRINEELRPIN